MIYKIKLPNFEGPFDLLLYFIRRDELNVYDIPIAKITEEFLKYIRLMKIFDLELAGEFLSMAANLIYIKTQMLLPKEKSEDGAEPDDPRAQLVQRLIEYKQFKEASQDLAEYGEEQRYAYYRELFSTEQKIVAEQQPTGFRNATVFDLFAAFQACLDRLKKNNVHHEVQISPVTVEEKREFIMNQIRTQKRLKFFDIIQYDNRNIIVVTFLAILDLVKFKLIAIRQEQLFEDIYIFEASEVKNELLEVNSN